MKAVDTPLRRALLSLLSLAAAVLVANVLVLAVDGLRWGLGSGGSEPITHGNIASRGSRAIRLFDTGGGGGRAVPLATDGTSLWYAAGSGDGTQGLYRLDPTTGASEKTAPLEWQEFPQWMGRIEGATVLMTGHRVVVVRDDGTKEEVGLPRISYPAGMEGGNYVEGVSLDGDRLLMVRFGALEIAAFKLTPKLELLPVIPLPANLPPPRSIRALDGEKVLLATDVAYPAQGYAPGMWVFDIDAGPAGAVAGAKAPSVISAGGAVVFIDSGTLARLDPAGPRADALSAPPVPDGSLAATSSGDVWHVGFKETAITFTSARGFQRTFQLPTIVGYDEGPPTGEWTVVRRDRPMAPAIMVTLADGSLVFSSADTSVIGVIPKPR